MNKNSVKYLQGISFSKITYADKTEIKNLRRARPEFFISQSSSSRKHAHVRKFNPATLVKYKWLIGCPEIIALLSPSK